MLAFIYLTIVLSYLQSQSDHSSHAANVIYLLQIHKCSTFYTNGRAFPGYLFQLPGILIPELRQVLCHGFAVHAAVVPVIIDLDVGPGSAAGKCIVEVADGNCRISADSLLKTMGKTIG